MTLENFKAIGDKFFENGNYINAIQQYNSALEIDPQRVDVLFNRGVAQKRANQRQEAVISFVRCLKLNPLHEKSLRNLGALGSSSACASLAFVAVDLKLTSDRRVIVLELANGMRSGATGLESIESRPIEEILADAVRTCHQLPLFVASKPGTHHFVKAVVFSTLLSEHEGDDITTSGQAVSEYTGVVASPNSYVSIAAWPNTARFYCGSKNLH